MIEGLLKKAKKGDADAFCRLMDMQMQSLYKVAKSYLRNDEDIADAISETVLLCFENLQTLRQNRYFKTWMIRILINKCKDILKTGSQINYTDEVPEVPVYEEEFAAAEWKFLLESLDERYRTILLLYYLEGFNTTDISQMMDLNESTVKSRLQRGRKKVIQEYNFTVKERQV